MAFFNDVPKPCIPGKDTIRAIFRTGIPERVSAASLARHLYTREEAVCDFMALCSGKRTGQKISLLFNPHRFDTATKTSCSIVKAWNEKKGFLDGVSRAFAWKVHAYSSREVLYQVLQTGINGIQYVNEFPPHVAREHFRSLCAKRILDPCAGWGGRMIGAASIGAHYVGFEPGSKTFDGLQQLGEWLVRFDTGFTFQIHQQPFEDAVLCEQFDIAYTSPPYYDTEHYAPGEKSNSMNRYTTFNEWVNGFYLPMIRNSLKATTNGFILNVGKRQYDLLTPLAEFEYKEIPTRLSGIGGLCKKKDGKESFYFISRSK